VRASSIESFFEIPYITWYLLHYYVAVAGVIVVAILALTGSITSTTVAALLSGLFGYVLGSSSRASGQTQAPTTPTSTTKPGSGAVQQEPG
jgi:uncharacterized iron-regulated membrane protein